MIVNRHENRTNPLKQIFAGLIQTPQWQGRLSPSPQNLQLGVTTDSYLTPAGAVAGVCFNLG